MKNRIKRAIVVTILGCMAIGAGVACDPNVILGCVPGTPNTELCMD